MKDKPLLCSLQLSLIFHKTEILENIIGYVTFLSFRRHFLYIIRKTAIEGRVHTNENLKFKIFGEFKRIIYDGLFLGVVIRHESS